VPFCVFCGKPVTATDKFCKNCGKPVSASQAQKNPEIKAETLAQAKTPEVIVSGDSNRSSSFVGSQESLPAVETVKMIVPDQVMVYGFGKADTFNLIITTHRTIFVKLTNSIKEQAQKKMNDKVNGAKMNRVIKWMAKRVDYSAYLNWYADKTPQQALNETPGNYAIPNTDIIDVTVNDNSVDSDEGGTVPDFELVITTREKMLKLKSIINPDNIRGKSIYDAYKK
jgi:hypothetical protein